MKMSEPVYGNIIHKETQDKDRRNKRQQTPQHTGSDSVKSRSSRAAVVCLVLLCVLLLTAILVLCVHIHTNNTNYTEQRNELLTKITNLTEDRDELQTKNNKLSEDRDELLTKITNLTEDRDELQTKNNKLTEDRDELQTKNNKLTEEKDELLTKSNKLTEEKHMLTTKNGNLLNERNLLINQRSVLCKNNEWIYYQYSLYYMSNVKKNWTGSREDCQKIGADLIIINDREEQDFVKKITVRKDFWIGVTDADEEGTWKWVDGSRLTTGFWASKEPNGKRVENCAVTYLTKHPELTGWIDVKCDDAHQWICEKSIQP